MGDALTRLAGSISVADARRVSEALNIYATSVTRGAAAPPGDVLSVCVVRNIEREEGEMLVR